LLSGFVTDDEDDQDLGHDVDRKKWREEDSETEAADTHTHILDDDACRGAGRSDGGGRGGWQGVVPASRLGRLGLCASLLHTLEKFDLIGLC